MKILVVDDEQDIALLFSQRFKEEIRTGLLEFLYALSGEEALDLLNVYSDIRLVLILSDINMPGINGLQLLKQIKSDHSSLVVFIITAYGDTNSSQTAWEYGAEEIITKPIHFSYLKNLIFDVIRMYQSKENQ